MTRRHAAYEAVRLRETCGATPRAPAAHLLFEGRFVLPAVDAAPIAVEALAQAERISGAGPQFAWMADLRPDPRFATSPVAAVVGALLVRSGFPSDAVQAEKPDESGLEAVLIVSPWTQAARKGIELALRLLGLAVALREQARLELDLAPWRALVADLAAALPHRSTMRLQAELERQAIDTEWTPGRGLLVGQGAQRRQVRLRADGSVPLPATEALAPAVARAFPAADTRIPVYTVTGSIGKTTTVRLLSQLLAPCGLRLGVTASDGAWIGGRRVAQGDCIGGRMARSILRHPEVEAAVLELGRGGMLEQGVPHRHSDVGVLLNLRPIHLGVDGVETVERMAEVKALSLRPAALAVLNRDDAHCRGIGAARPPDSVVWFSTSLTEDELAKVSRSARGAVGLARGSSGQAQAVEVWGGGSCLTSLPLEGVAPFHGIPTAKTWEQLCAVVAAGWFGPLPVRDWDLRRLRLDADNHVFRASVHRRGEVRFMLDKAGAGPQVELLRETVEAVCRAQGIERRIGVLTRSAAAPPERMIIACGILHGFLDEFVLFERPDAYARPEAREVYRQVPVTRWIADEFARLDTVHGTRKPVVRLEDWDAVEGWLDRRLADCTRPTLVLINQPTTSASELIGRIVGYVDPRPQARNPRESE